MTAKEIDENCYCDSYPETSSIMCHVCEYYYDERTEQQEIDKRKRIQEQNEY